MLYASLTDMLQQVLQTDRHIRFIDGDKDESVLSYARLWDEANGLLAALQSHGIGAGDELVIYTRSNQRFVIAFWAAILGGIVPVPVAVGISDEHRLKLFRILRQLRSGSLYTESGLLGRLKRFAATEGMAAEGRLLDERAVLDADVRAGLEPKRVVPERDNIAFIQYSSGSTSDPKGVCLTHHNLTTHLRALCERVLWDTDDYSLSWMPLTHDMGLIGYHLTAVASQMSHAIMDTSVFVRRPLLWMLKASEYRATQLCSPNFGLKHFLKVFERRGIGNIDLSSVKQLLNGAEPISWELCEQFLQALAPFGLKRTVMCPVYGLAEATLGVTLPYPGTEYSRVIVDRHSLRIGEPCRETMEDDPDAVSFVNVGYPVRDTELRITDDDDRELPARHVGNIQIRGDSVTTGIYNNPEVQAQLFADGQWLRTGDCGMMIGDDLFVTGRSKDIIIVNGQNYYPHDIESVVCDLDEFDLGKVVVTSIRRPSASVEEIIVFLLYRQDLESFVEIAQQVRSVVASNTGLEVDHVIPVGRIPKTTSGKVQRAQLAKEYANGDFDEVVATLRQLGQAEAQDGDPLVQELLDICREQAGEVVIGPDDNLFEVGVSSITLTEISIAVDTRFPGKVDINDLFEHPTIREIADIIRQ
ncbi:MAG: non-ribosomal peptide synthetase [Gammaproteobacteria bacterium]|nr:non-ribosomal peptide synthetase [Gammaproteobacteria bacterium]